MEVGCKVTVWAFVSSSAVSFRLIASARASRHVFGSTPD